MRTQTNAEEPFVDEDSGHLHYGRLFEFMLSQTSKAFGVLEQEGKLPEGITLGMKTFKPCHICKMQNTHCEPCIELAKLVGTDNPDSANPDCSDCLNKQAKLNVFTPATHCRDCIPVVTHTKQGICILLKGHGKTLIMDLIPVLPSPQDVTKEPLMGLYKTITTSLLIEMPPGWKKAFMAYFTKDKAVPEEMHELSQVIQNFEEDNNLGLSHQGKKKPLDDNKVNGMETCQNATIQEKHYILVKLLNYGPTENYQIRATQPVNAIANFTGERTDALAYQYVKTLGKLLEIDGVGSYLTKKLYLSQTNIWRSWTIAAGKERQERLNLFAVLASHEILLFFRSRIDCQQLALLQVTSSFVEDGLIPIIPK